MLYLTTSRQFWATWETESDADSLPLIDHILLSCPNLITLHIHGSLDVVSPLLATLHANLESLSIGNFGIDGQVLAIAISERMFPKLKTVVLLSSCGWEADVTTQVEMMCDLVGAKFICR